MQTTLEQIIEAAQRLSPAEIEKLDEWVKERRRSNPAETKTQSENETRGRLMRWLKDNRERYGGQYVVLDADKLLGTAKNYAEGRRIALDAGVPDAFVDYLSKPDEEGFVGGW